MMKRLAGGFLIGMPLGGLFGAHVAFYGFWTTVLVWLTGIGSAALILLGGLLILSDR